MLLPTILRLRVMEAFSLVTRARALSIAGCPTQSTKVAPHALNSLPPVQSRCSLVVGYQYKPFSISGDSSRRVAFADCWTGKSSSFLVRARGVSAENAATATWVEDLKKGDLYFSDDSRPVVLFDGVCNMCNGGVNFLLDSDTAGKLRFAALQSGAGRALLVRCGRSPDDISSIVLVDKDRAYIKSEAVIRAGHYLGFPFPPVAFLAYAVPLFLRDLVYDAVADNRYSIFGQTNTCRVSDPRFAERFLE